MQQKPIAIQAQTQQQPPTIKEINKIPIVLAALHADSVVQLLRQHLGPVLGQSLSVSQNAKLQTLEALQKPLQQYAYLWFTLSQ